jgi:hypothetical protein
MKKPTAFILSVIIVSLLGIAVPAATEDNGGIDASLLRELKLSLVMDGPTRALANAISGDKGYWTMYDDWFDKYVLVVIVNKKYLGADDRKLLELEPVVLPSWDPLAACLR